METDKINASHSFAVWPTFVPGKHTNDTLVSHNLVNTHTHTYTDDIIVSHQTQTQTQTHAWYIHW